VNLDPEKLIVLFVIAMFIMGPKRLPEAARAMGRWMAELRKYTSGFQSEFHDLLSEPREQGAAIRDELRNAFSEPRAALEAGARDAQDAANAAGTEWNGPDPAVLEPTYDFESETVSFSPETVSAPLNSVPDDPTLN
jgi:Sec-independent protein translocase protein TatA